MNQNPAPVLSSELTSPKVPDDVSYQDAASVSSCEQEESVFNSATGQGTPASLSEIDWGQALRENEQWLRTIIAARVGERAAVEEVFQEVSLATIRQKAPLQDPTKVSAWLYRLAVTQSLLYRRSAGRKRKLIDRYTQRVPLVEHDVRQKDPLEWLIDQERCDNVKKAMARLPQREKDLLLLKYVHDCSYRDMADKLGISVSAVQARLHRARALLRDTLLSIEGKE